MKPYYEHSGKRHGCRCCNIFMQMDPSSKATRRKNRVKKRMGNKIARTYAKIKLRKYK